MKDESLALELLKDSSKRNKRTFTVLLNDWAYCLF